MREYAERPATHAVSTERAARGGAHPLVALHRSAGNAAVARWLAGTVVQRNGTAPPPASPAQASRKRQRDDAVDANPARKDARTIAPLWQEARHAMFEAGLSPHGARKWFEAEARARWGRVSDEQLVHGFLEQAKAEAAKPRVKGVRKWTRPLRLSRPSWPKPLKAKLGHRAGQDIRHIVRNATIMRALVAEHEWQKANNRGGELAAFQGLAQTLGINVRGARHPWELLRRVYTAAYLNPGNLFAGPSAVNRIIGLTADRIQVLGATPMGTEPEAAIKKIFGTVATLVSNEVAKSEAQAGRLVADGRLNAGERDEFLRDVDAFHAHFADYLDGTEDRLLEAVDEGADDDLLRSLLAAEAGDISAGFGFDLPSVAAPASLPTLIEVETFLAAYSGGRIDQLAATLDKFLKLPALPLPPAAP
jgi:hypothetical protein